MSVHADEEGFQDKIKRLKDAQKKDVQASSENGQKGLSSQLRESSDAVAGTSNAVSILLSPTSPLSQIL